MTSLSNLSFASPCEAQNPIGGTSDALAPVESTQSRLYAGTPCNGKPQGGRKPGWDEETKRCRESEIKGSADSLEDEEGVEGEDDGVRVGEVRLIPANQRNKERTIS